MQLGQTQPGFADRSLTSVESGWTLVTAGVWLLMKKNLKLFGISLGLDQFSDLVCATSKKSLLWTATLF